MPDSFLRRSRSPTGSVRSNSLTSGQPVIYCLTCSCSLSSSCIISGAHQNHKLRELDDAAQQRKNDLVKSSSNLESKIKKFVKISERIEEEELKLEEVCERTREALHKEYSTLMALVEQNQQQAFRLLNAHKETMRQHLHQIYSDSQNYHQTSTNLMKNIQELNSRDFQNSASLLGEISAMEISMETMNEFYSTLKDKLKLDHSRVKALETSVRKIVEKNRELLPRPWEFSEKITLDSQTKQGNMQISEDNTEIWVAGCTTRANGRTPSDTVSSRWGSVLASQKFKKGQHYWEVNVGSCKNWVVGIVEQSRSSKEGPAKSPSHRRSWVLECDNEEILAMHNDDFCDVKENDVQTLGVFLDCDKGRVKFYNVATGTILHYFVVNFKRPLIPTFSIKPNKKTARLKICNLSDEDNTPYESDAESVHSQSQSQSSPESVSSSS